MENAERLVGRFLAIEVRGETRYGLVTHESSNLVEYRTPHSGDRQITTRAAILRMVDAGKVVVR